MDTIDISRKLLHKEIIIDATGAKIFALFYSTTRYELDFVPLLAIVAVQGMWRLYEDTRPYPIQSRLAAGGILLIVTAGTLVSLLLAVSGAGSNFDDLNPGLFSFLVNLLPHW